MGTSHVFGSKYYMYICLLYPVLWLSVCGIPCKNFDDCNRGKKIQCSICDESRCVYPFSDVYYVKSDRADQCIPTCHCGDDIKPCINEVACVDGWGLPVCICPDSSYGYYCNISTSHWIMAISKHIHYSFPVIITMGASESMRVMPELRGYYPEFTVRYGAGGFVRNTTVQETSEDCALPIVAEHEKQRGERSCDFYSNLNIRLPYEANSPKRIMSSDSLQGYFTSLKLSIRNKVNNNVILAYENSIELFVKTDTSSPNKHRCSCSIKLQGCGNTLETPVTYHRSSNIIIDPLLHFYYDGLRPHLSPVSDVRCKADCKFTWKMWKIVPEDVEISHDELSVNFKPALVGTKDSKIVLKPYTIDYGLYKLLFEVKYVPEGDPPLNFAWCYFDMRTQPLVLNIYEGTDRIALHPGKKHVVFYTQGIHFASSLSSDPNHAPNTDNQKHVYIKWTCLTMNDYIVKTTCKLKSKVLHVWQTYDVEPEMLEYRGEYIFSVRLWTDYYKNYAEDVRKIMGEKTAKITVAVDYELLKIKCLKNCDTIASTNEELILKLSVSKYNLTENDYFTWMYNKDGEESKPIPKSMMVPGYPKIFLILKANSLDKIASYNITAKHNRKLPVTNYYLKTVDAIVYNGRCQLDPPTGQKGVTEFNIECPLELGFEYLFEFYDKYKEEIEDGVIYSGRMLGSSYSGKLHNVILTRGFVMVYIINKQGVSVSHQINVELSDCSVNVEYLHMVKHKIAILLEMGEIQRILGYISFVPDIFLAVIAKDEMISYLLGASLEMSITNIAESKLATSTLRNVVVGMNKRKDCYLPVFVVMNTLKQMCTITEVLDKDLRDIQESREDNKYLDSKTVQHITTYIIDSLYFILLYANNDTYEVNENFIDLDISFQLMLSTKYAECILHNVQNILTYMQFPVKPAKIFSIEETYIIWVVMNHADFSFLDVLKISRDIHQISISDHLMEDLLNKINSTEEMITLQLTDCKQNIAWWSSGNVKSNILSTKFVIHNKAGNLKNILTLDEPIDVLFKMHDTQPRSFTSTVSHLNSSTDPLSLDLNVKVYRLDLPTKTFTYVMFRYPPTKDPLRVLVLKNYRPDYKLMMENAVIINETSTLISIKVFNYDKQPIHYMGILPGPKVQMSESSEFTFEINTTKCQVWTSGWWTGRNCDVRNYAINHTVICSCKHLSMFSVGVPNPPEYIELYTEFTMLLSVYNNYLVIMVTLFLLLLYLITFIWALCRDCKDKALRKISILEDNYPCDRIVYLVSVWTSSRLDAGTTAHVAIKIFGEDHDSRVHILSSKNYTVLKRNTENWFLILCPESLGNLYFLRVWHDNYGSSPDWYCDKICVIDLENNIEYIFPIEQWMSLRLDEYPEAAVLPAFIEDLRDKKRKFLDNLRYEMRECHLVTGVMLRHARSYITRLERLTILMCCVMIAISWSVFFYLRISHQGVDDSSNDINLKYILVSFQIQATIYIFIMLITFLFRKSAKFSYERMSSFLIIRTSSTGELPFLKTLKPVKAEQLKLTTLNESDTVKYIDLYGTSMFDKFVRALYSMRRTVPKVPVHLPHCKSKVTVCKLWYMAVWAICIAIITLLLFFIAVWSRTLGHKKSQKCIFSAVLGICLEIFIFRPLEILVFSSIFCFGSKLTVGEKSYNINTDDLSYYRKLYNNRDHYRKLVKMRSLSMYRPIIIDDRKIYQIKRLKYHRWSKVISFIIIFIFIISLNFVIINMLTLNYYSNRHTKQIFDLGHSKIGTVDFFNINSTTGIESYLLGTFIRAVYLLRWYNGQLISNKNLGIHSYRMSDYTRKMIGKPSIRQLRVRPIPCSHLMSQGKMKCIPQYSFDNEDKNLYGPRWTPADWNETKDKDSPWHYNHRPNNWLFKQFNCYGGMGKELNYGGYMVYLSPYRFESIIIVTDLKEQMWLDHMTKAVIIDITIYDVSENVFSHITMFVERAVLYFHKIHVDTVPWSKTFYLSDLIVIMILAYFVIKSVQTVNKQGLLHYMSEMENILQIIIIVFSSVIIILILIHFHHAKSYLKTFEISTHLGHFEFNVFAYYLKIARILIGVLLLITIIQLLCVLELGSFINFCYFAFILNLKNIAIITTLVVILIIVQWRFLSFLLNINLCYRVSEAVIETFSSPKYHHKEVSSYFILGHLCVKSVMFSFVMIYLQSIKVARWAVKDSFNFVTFIFSEIKQFGVRKRK